jgi:hypothetical protein
MNPLEFLFALIENYVPVNPGRFEALKSQAKLWYYGGTDDEGNRKEAEADQSRVGQFIKTKGEIWYFQIGLAFFYLFAAKSLHDLINEKDKDSVGL